MYNKQFTDGGGGLASPPSNSLQALPVTNAGQLPGPNIVAHGHNFTNGGFAFDGSQIPDTGASSARPNDNWLNALIGALRPGDNPQEDMQAIWDRQLASNRQNFEDNMRFLDRQMRYNTLEAQKTRDWQEKMRASQYQDTVQDMLKAGLNPILAITKGFGSTTPSSAAAAVGLGSQSQMSVDTHNQYYDSQRLKLAKEELTLAKIAMVLNSATAIMGISKDIAGLALGGATKVAGFS